MDRFKWNDMSIKNWIFRNRIHLIAWTCFIFWESILTGLIFGEFGKLGNYIIHYVVNISLFYVHTWLLEKAIVFPRQAIWKIPLLVFLELFIYCYGVLSMDMLLIRYTDLIPHGFIPTITRILQIVMAIIILFTFFHRLFLH